MNFLGYHPCQPGYYQAGKKYFELAYSEDCCLGNYVCQMFEISRPYEHNICIVPDGCNDILVSFDGQEVRGWISQSIPSPMEFRFEKAEWLFGVRFYPGATYFLFDNNIEYDSQKPIDIKLLIPDFEQVEDDFKQSLSFARRHEIMEKFLIKVLEESGGVGNILSFCVNKLIETNGIISIDELATMAGYGSRYIRQLFADHVGHSTKELANIIRVQKTLQFLFEGTDEKLKDIAVKFGFSDHSHMNREFKRFLGVTSSQIKEDEEWNSVLKAKMQRIF